MSIAVFLIYVLICLLDVGIFLSTVAWERADLAAASALSLPCTPTCAGTQTISGVSVSSAWGQRASLWCAVLKLHCCTVGSLE